MRLVGNAAPPLALHGLALPLALALSLPAVAQATGEPPARPSHPLAALSLDSLAATRERPLFSPTRRPPAPPPAPVAAAAAPPPPPPPAPPEPPALTFFGVVAEGDGARALVRVGAENESLRVRVGDRIGAWAVSDIDRRRLVLSLGDRLETFTLFARQSEKQTLVASPDARQQGAQKRRLAPRSRAAPAQAERTDEPEL